MIIDILGSLGCLDLVKKIFFDMDDLVKKDMVLYNFFLYVYCKLGQVEIVNELFNFMKQKDCWLDLFIYNIIMNMYVKIDVGFIKVFLLFKEMCL